MRQRVKSIKLISINLFSKVSLFRCYPTNPKTDKITEEKQLIQQFACRQVYSSNKEEIKSGIYYLNSNFSDFFSEENILGEGTVGIVKKVRSIKTKKYYACKIVKTKDDETIFNIKFEFLHLRKLKHPRIIKVKRLFIDPILGKVYTIMELVNAPEMFITIQNIGTYSEAMARDIFKKILEGIQFLHSHGVCHRDLKPNNILCDSTGENIKITDFNVSKFCDDYKTDISRHIQMITYTGTIAFSAPELLSHSEYNEKVDMWSLGTVLYCMLCGKQPFQAEYIDELIEVIIQGNTTYQEPIWSQLSAESKDLTKQLLTKDPSKRINCTEALNHP